MHRGSGDRMERPPAFLLASSAAAPAAVHTTTAVESELQRQPAAASGAATEEKEEEEEEAWGVIDDDLLARALLPSTTAGQEGAQGSRSSEQRKGGQAVPDLVDAITQATALELSHCRLRRIDHLVGFRYDRSQLTRLRLDNNGITTMANLEELVHLTWLDLSFNRIERISGLESLRKLTDLFLYHNRIHDAEGLAQAGCRGLQYLSLGHNRLDLSRPSSLLSLLAKRFPALEALVLHKQEQQLPPPEQEEQQQEEKEVGEEEEVKAAVVKALPQLQYLDHALVKQPIVLGDDAEKKGARLGVVGA